MKVSIEHMKKIVEDPTLFALMLGMMSGQLARVGETEAFWALMQTWYDDVGPCAWIQGQENGKFKDGVRKKIAGTGIRIVRFHKDGHGRVVEEEL